MDSLETQAELAILRIYVDAYQLYNINFTDDAFTLNTGKTLDSVNLVRHPSSIWTKTIAQENMIK